MNDKFDELAKGMAQSVTRRGALKKFGVGIAGIALATLGLANRAEAKNCFGKCGSDCAKIYPRGSSSWELCVTNCVDRNCSP